MFTEEEESYLDKLYLLIFCARRFAQNVTQRGVSYVQDGQSTHEPEQPLKKKKQKITLECPRSGKEHWIPSVMDQINHHLDPQAKLINTPRPHRYIPSVFGLPPQL